MSTPESSTSILPPIQPQAKPKPKAKFSAVRPPSLVATSSGSESGPSSVPAMPPIAGAKPSPEVIKIKPPTPR